MPCPSAYENVEAAFPSETDVAIELASAPSKWRRSAAALCGLAAIGTAVAATTRSRPGVTNSSVASAPERVVVLSEGGGCAAPGEECTNSKCCQDAGPEGYQCFAKNDGWAMCLESCQKGPHEDESDGEYDQYGNFKKFEWTCKKLGDRSLRGCDALDSKKKCAEEKERCTWGWKNGTDACLVLCDVLPAGESCWSQEHCMVHDGKCTSACGTFDEKKCPTDRCTFTEDKCMKACYAIGSEDECNGAKWDSRGCVWEDNMCQRDSCSAMDENCVDTGCCSAHRGGMGKQCFQKDKNYGKCMEYCEEEMWGEKWSCKTTGNATKFPLGCSWIGKDCSETNLCCQVGSACVVKDELFTGCVQTQEIGSWEARDIPLPEDWSGPTLGGSRAEYMIPPAGEGEEKAGTSLFCFMAYLPPKYNPDLGEDQLMYVAKDNNASIFGCDLYSVFESWSSEKKQWDTGGDGASIANTDVFLDVWLKLKEDGKYLKADWTVKVDPDAVLVASRLKEHIERLSPPANMPIYLKNNDMDKGLGNNGFLGAIEIFTKQAVQIYFDNWEGCKEAYGLDSGEDGFFKGCMDSLGVGFMTDAQIFKPDFSPGACGDGDMVGFHPLKERSQWLCCWQIILGKTRDVKFGKCEMGLDGNGPEEEPEYGGTVR